MKFTECYLKEDFNFVYGEDIEPEDGESAEQLAKDENINILSDKELSIVVKDVEGNIIGALWTSWVDNIFSFDVVVSLHIYNRGLGTKLVDKAISQYEMDKEAYGEDAEMEIDVISNIMKHILEKKGFEVKNQYNGRWIMTKR